MYYPQMIEEQQFSESAYFDRFLGYDRGYSEEDTKGGDYSDRVEKKCIGRMRAEWDGKVEVFQFIDRNDPSAPLECFEVTLTFADGRTSSYSRDTKEQAIKYARWWLDGCPA